MTKQITEYQAALRQIGWDHWDPIGIRAGADQTAWQGRAADEYDFYLFEADAMLAAGSSVDRVTAYLRAVCDDDGEGGYGIGVRLRPGACERTVEAISALREARHP